MNGPMTDGDLAIFTKHLSSLCGREMVLDPEAYGHEIYDENRARYQWKVKGGKTSDYQGVALKATMNPEIYIIRHNRVDVVIRIDTEKAPPVNAPDVLPPSFTTVLTEAMEPYEDMT